MSAPAQSAEIKKPTPANSPEQTATPIFKEDKLNAIRAGVAANASAATGETYTPLKVTPAGENPLLRMVRDEKADKKAHAGDVVAAKTVPESFNSDEGFSIPGVDPNLLNYVVAPNKTTYTMDNGNEFNEALKRKNEAAQSQKDHTPTKKEGLMGWIGGFFSGNKGVNEVSRNEQGSQETQTVNVSAEQSHQRVVQSTAVDAAPSAPQLSGLMNQPGVSAEVSPSVQALPARPNLTVVPSTNQPVSQQPAQIPTAPSQNNLQRAA